MADYQISATLRLRDEMSAKLSAARREAEKLTRGIGDAKNKDVLFNIKTRGLENLKRYNDLLKQAGMTTPKPVNLRVNDNNATSKISKIRSELTSLSSKAWNVAVSLKTNGADKLGKMKNNLTELTTGAALGMGGTILGTAGIGYGVVNAFQSQMDFEKQMSSVQAILGYEKAQMTALTQAAEEIGYSTKFTAAEAAGAEYFLGMAGFGEEQIIAGTRGVVNLAAAGNEDLRRTADVVSDLMTAFGLKAGVDLNFDGKPAVESTQHFVDAMAALITNANTDIGQGYEALKYSAPVVAGMYAGQGAEAQADAMRDSLIITGLMANSGIKGSMAGTSQRSLYTRLASENRNAFFSERALGINFTNENGDIRRLRDIIGDMRNAFQNGLEVDQVLDFAEALSGEKVHADTRRKLNSFIENVTKNGGQMGGADRLKMTSMLAGQEAMSGWLSVLLASQEDWDKLANAIDNADGKAKAMADTQLDNLAGDITKLGSAWDAFQRNLVKGDASAGLRDFSQGLTDALTNANNLFKDGIQISDFAKIGIDAIERLKNKFLELDGIGSILAGGALFFGMKKILSMGLQLKDTLSTWSKVRTTSDFGNILRGNQGGVVGTSQVGTMHVNAGVVHLNGAIKGGMPNSGGVNQGRGGISTGGGINSGTVASRNAAYVNDYYARKQGILSSQIIHPPTGVPPAVSTGAMGTLRAAAPAIGGAGILAGVFGALDIYSAKSHSEMTMQEARSTVQYHKNVLAELQSQNARQEDIALAKQNVVDAEAFVERTRIMNQNVENQAMLGAGGAVAGTLAGAALGSFVPVIGTAIGAMIGGILGQYGGVALAEYGADARDKRRQDEEDKESANIPAGSWADFRREDEGYLAYTQSEDYKQQQDELQAQKAQAEALQSENALKNNATAMSRRQTADYLESQGINANELPSYDAVKRHKGDSAHQAYFEYNQKMARGESVARQRDEYNKNWQKQHGYSSLAGNPNFVPENEEDRKALAFYDEVQANKERQKNLLADIQQSQPPKEDSGVQIFSKAEAGELTPETNMTLSTPENSPVKPQDSKGIFDFEMPNFELPNISECFSNFEIPDIGGKLGEMFSGIEPPDISSWFSNFEIPDIGGKLSEMFSGIEPPNLGEWFSNFEMPDLGIAEKFSAEFENASSIFEGFTSTALSAFEGVSSGISGALSGVGSAITSVFSSTASEVQSIWGAVPGFFDGVFGSLGGVAASAGGAISSGLTGVIGGIIGAWQSAAATISGIISSIAQAASEAATAAGNFFSGGVGSNAKGTSYWKGGWTEINEHGGEIINLPKGTQIYPHATTVNILRREISESIQRGDTNFHGINFADYGMNILSGDNITKMSKINLDTNIFGGRRKRAQSVDNSPLSGDILTGGIPTLNFPKTGIGGIFGSIFNSENWSDFIMSDFSLPKFEIPQSASSNVSSTSTTSNANNTFNFGGVNISNGADFDEFVFRLQQMMSMSSANSEMI